MRKHTTIGNIANATSPNFPGISVMNKRVICVVLPGLTGAVASYVVLPGLYKIPNNNTANIGPAALNPTNPKLSLCASLSLLTAAAPAPKAKRNGTVMAPVEAPPESKASDRNSLGAKNDNVNITAYTPIRTYANLILNITLNMEKVKNNPTPSDTVNIKTISGIPGTCCANTVRLGSDTVTAVPIIRLAIIINHSFRDFVIDEPTLSPIGIMAISAPNVNSPIPRISITAPRIKVSIIPLSAGKKIKQSINTTMVTGKTEESDSFNFSSSIVLLCFINSLFSLLITCLSNQWIIIYHNIWEFVN